MIHFIWGVAGSPGALELDELERVLMNVPDCTSIHLVVAEKLCSSYVSSESTLGSAATGESASNGVSAASGLVVRAKLQGADCYRETASCRSSRSSCRPSLVSAMIQVKVAAVKSSFSLRLETGMYQERGRRKQPNTKLRRSKS